MILGLIGFIIFVVGYIGIATEHSTHINKSAWALATGGILWFLVALKDYSLVEEAMTHAGYEIFSIVLFLLAAMSLVEILITCGVFDHLRHKMLSYNLGNVHQFWILAVLAFFLSAIIDNLTATIILIQIARKFFRGNDLLVVGVGIVLAANAGGAMSPIGDITTIMLWLAGKFSAFEIITHAFLPASAIFGVSAYLISRKLNDKKDDVPDTEDRPPLDTARKIIITATLLSFFMPILAKTIHLPPVSGILFGLGITWLLFDFYRRRMPEESRFSESMDDLVKKTDISSIQFFVGILLAVSALGTLGVLDVMSHYIYGENQEFLRIVMGNIGLGVISAFLDNIPLTAIAIDILDVQDTNLWVLLAITAGTGGSLLAIGSAAGVVAMGLLKSLSFKKYFLIGFVPALAGYVAGITVWYIQTLIFF